MLCQAFAEAQRYFREKGSGFPLKIGQFSHKRLRVYESRIVYHTRGDYATKNPGAVPRDM